MKDRFSSLTIALHWFVLALLAAVYACIESRVHWPEGSDTRELLKTWHLMLGLSVFALVWVRLVARVRDGTPPIVPVPPACQNRVGQAMPGALYLLMIAMPLGGWLIGLHAAAALSHHYVQRDKRVLWMAPRKTASR